MSSHLCFFHPGRKARGLQTSSYPEKQSSWFSPPISVTTTEAWTCWRTAAELLLPLQPLFTSLRSVLPSFSNTVLHRNLHVYVSCLNVGRPSKCQTQLWLKDVRTPLERRRMETYIRTDIENFNLCYSEGPEMGQKWARSARCHVSLTADWSWNQSITSTTADTIWHVNECLVYHFLLKTESQMLVGVGFKFSVKGV